MSKVMESLQMSQTALAERLGIDRAAVNKMLAGTRSFGRNSSMNIVAKLNLNPEWWETGEGEMFLPKSNTTATVNASSLAEIADKELLAKHVATQEELIRAKEEIIRLKDQLLDKQLRENENLKRENERLKNPNGVSDKS